jgi:electron transfer flavoprotein alpha subunit
MSHYIVLVKQVPDVSQITDNAFDPKSGNLVRSRLPSVINELDAQAFALASHLKAHDPDPHSRLICLTMGPPMAAEVLNYGLSRGADEAILLTDPAMGGADTVATANPLAAAIRKVAETFDESDDYLIIAGMQSVDGDTAQVPAQIAEELAIPFLPYVTGFDFSDEGLRLERFMDRHIERVAPSRYPAVITVSDYPYQVFPSLAATRRARSTSPTTWRAEDIEASALGVRGSKTRVTRVFPPEKSDRLQTSLASVEALAERLTATLSGDHSCVQTEIKSIDYRLPSRRDSRLDRSYEPTSREREEFSLLQSYLEAQGVDDPSEITSEHREALIESGVIKGSARVVEEMISGLSQTAPTYQGDVWVVAEVNESNELHPLSLELTGEARALADALEVEVGVVLLSKERSSHPDRLISAGADKVHLFNHPSLAQFDPALFTDLVTQIYETAPPQILLFGATDQGRALAPRVAYRTGCGLTADCTALEICDNSRRGEVALLMQTRPALGGNIMATIATKLSRTQMATVRAGIFCTPPFDSSRTGDVVEHHLTVDETMRSITLFEREAIQTALLDPNAEIIISGGKGLGSKENFDTVLTQLSETLSAAFPNLSVQIAGSRAAVEQGYIDRAYQVGQTGRSVKPRLYLALGISGAIQHMIGLTHADTLIAINPDPNAPIFEQCDYYLIDTAENATTAIANILKSRPMSGVDVAEGVSHA